MNPWREAPYVFAVLVLCDVLTALWGSARAVSPGAGRFLLRGGNRMAGVIRCDGRFRDARSVSLTL
jgi:hypothetical protein